MNEVFLNILKRKTRILVLHQLQFLHLSDQVVVLKQEGGQIAECGTYEKLRANSESELTRLIETHITEKEKQNKKKQSQGDTTGKDEEEETNMNASENKKKEEEEEDDESFADEGKQMTEEDRVVGNVR